MTRIDTRLSHVLSQRRRPSEYAKVLVTACLALYFVRLCRRSRQDRIYGTTDSKTSHSVQNPVVACWILRTNSTSDLFRSQAIEASWGEFCYSIDFIDKQTPGIIADWFEVYEDLSAKSYRAWNFMYRKYLSPDSKQVPLVDFILKADVDTYIIGHNMLEYVAHFDPDKPYYIGKNFIDLNGQHFVAGTAIILSRAALRILAHASSAHCSFEAFREKQAEDLALAICLQDLNIRPYDTRDSSGAERFMVFGPDMMRLGGADGRLPSWYYKFSQNKLVGKGCCSENAIAFHYTTIQQLQTQVLVLRDNQWFWTNMTSAGSRQRRNLTAPPRAPSGLWETSAIGSIGRLVGALP